MRRLKSARIRLCKELEGLLSLVKYAAIAPGLHVRLSRDKKPCNDGIGSRCGLRDDQEWRRQGC